MTPVQEGSECQPGNMGLVNKFPCAWANEPAPIREVKSVMRSMVRIQPTLRNEGRSNHKSLSSKEPTRKSINEIALDSTRHFERGPFQSRHSRGEGSINGSRKLIPRESRVIYAHHTRTIRASPYIASATPDLGSHFSVLVVHYTPDSSARAGISGPRSTKSGTMLAFGRR